jgi:hypothetical protein
MDRTNDLYDFIKDTIAEETRWLRHYTGIVLDVEDQEKKGWVLVGIMELGQESQAQGFWARPREKNIQIPKVDDLVEVYFMNGDQNKPCYVGILHDMKDQLCKNYTGTKDQIIFEDREEKDNKIMFDREEKQFIIGGKEKKIKILIDEYEIEDSNGNKIVASSTSIKINDNLEVLM